jgi:hypothetical protein
VGPVVFPLSTNDLFSLRHSLQLAITASRKLTTPLLQDAAHRTAGSLRLTIEEMCEIQGACIP